MSHHFLGYEVDVPFGPAAGAINGVNEDVLLQKARQVLRSPVGAEWIGSFTWNGGPGNEPEYGVAYYHNKLTGQTVNSMGLPNIGYHRAVELYPELKKEADDYGKPVIPSISPGKGEDPAVVLPDMVAGFVEAGAPIVEVNYSCPNKIDKSGGREPLLGNDPEIMFSIDEEITRRVGDDIWVIRKLPPYLGEKKQLIPTVTDGFNKTKGRVALNISNTVGGQKILTELGEPALNVPDNIGGMSGPATIEIGRDQLRRFRTELLLSRVVLISSLGVTTGQEVHYRVDEGRGAVFTSGVTLYTENESAGIDYGKTGVKIAEEYAEAA